MEAIKRWHRECVAKEMIEVLKKKGYNAIYVENIGSGARGDCVADSGRSECGGRRKRDAERDECALRHPKRRV